MEFEQAKEALHKRILFRLSPYEKGTVWEGRIREIAESGEYVKIEMGDSNGWYLMKNVFFIEVLPPIRLPQPWLSLLESLSEPPPPPPPPPPPRTIAIEKLPTIADFILKRINWRKNGV